MNCFRLSALLISLSFVTALAHAAPVPPDEDLDFSRQDHQLHMAAAYGATVTSGYLMKGIGVDKGLAPVLSFMLVMTAGYAKEAWIDKRFSSGDMQADAVGASTGMLFTFVF